MTYVVARYGSGAYAEAVGVATNLARLREEAGLSQSELGRRLGVPSTRIWDWESGRYKMPDTKTLIRLATVLTVSVDDLLAGLDTEYDAVLQARTNAPPAPKARPSLGRQVTRAVRLLETMSEKGQRVAVGSIAAIARAFPLGAQPESLAQPGGNPSVTARKARGRR